MRKKDLTLRRVQHPALISGGHPPLDAIEFLTTYPGRETRVKREIIAPYPKPAAPYRQQQQEVYQYRSSELAQMHLRNNHNELEKSRRAQLKECLKTLSVVVPMGNDTKETTLGLLKRSRRYIKHLEEKEKEFIAMKEELISEQNRLKRKLEFLEEEEEEAPKEEEEDMGMLREPELAEKEEALMSELSYRAEKWSSSFQEQVNSFEVASEKFGKEINLADAEGYCLLLDDINMLENFTYDHELGKIVIRGQLRRGDRDEIDLVEVII